MHQAFGAMVGMVLLVPTGARAEPAGRLVYTRGAGAETCPDEAELRRAVSARLGEDPFDAAAPRTFTAEIHAEGSGLVASIATLDADGISVGFRRIEVADANCAELVSAMALAMSLAINPDLVTAPPMSVPPMLPAPSPRTPDLSPRAEQRPGPAHGSRGFSFHVGALGHAALGTGPGVAAGGTLLFRARRSLLSIGLEGRFDTLSHMTAGRAGHAYSTLGAAVVAPCLHSGVVQACALGLLGSFAAWSSGVTVPDSDRGLYAASGARVGVEWAFAPRLRLEAHLDGLFTLIPVSIVLNGSPIWEAPPVSGVLGAGLVAEIP